MTKRTRHIWTDADIEILRAQYPDTSTKIVAAQLGLTERAVYGKAKNMGITKSAEYLASPAACRLRRGDRIGEAYRFKPGQVPVNKGLRRPGYGPGNMKKTMFAKGSKPRNWLPIGSHRHSKEGYLQQKMTDTGYPPRDWVCVHHLIWQAIHGPVPKGHRLVFINGDRTDIRLENIELITMRELMRRNTIHNLPEELKEVITLKGAITRRITNGNRKNNRGSARSAVRNAGSPAQQGQADGDRAGESDL